MRRARTALMVLAMVALAACKREASGGVPPASEWKPPAPKPSSVEGGRHGGGTARGNASHALGAKAADPHAGLDMDEEEAAAPDVADDGEEAHGDDEEEMAPRETVASGQIRVSGDAAAVVKPGSILYVSAVPVDGAGKPSGSAVAVDRFEVSSLPMSFELAGARYEGDAVITAWTDADGEARTRQPGDAEGHVKARLPADGIDLVLDSVLK